MKKDLREIYLAPSRALAEVAIDLFTETYQAKHHKAVECLTKDREALLAFFNFPAEHWDHLRTTNPIESVFATVRHRTVRTKGSLSPTTARLMVFKLVIAASKTWRRLKGTNHLPKIVAGVRFKDASRSSNCRKTTPPDRAASPKFPHSSARHPESPCADAHAELRRGLVTRERPGLNRGNHALAKIR